MTMAIDRLNAFDRRSEARLALAGFRHLYETQLKSERKSPKTIEAYHYVLGKFEEWWNQENEEPANLADFTALNVRLFLVATQERRKWVGHPFLDGATEASVSGATIHHYVRSLKTFGAWLEREAYVPTHPLINVKLPRLDEKQLRPLTEEEERQLLSTYDENEPGDCRTKSILLLMLDTGLRLSEVINLLDQNVDLDNGFLTVMGKGRKERAVPFGYTTEKVLRKYAVFFRPEPATEKVEEFFLDPEGYPMTNKGIVMVFARARRRTGIKRLHAHLLRHTYGIRAQENDMPTITLQHYMGHSSSKVTERYAHAAQSEKLKRARGFSPIDLLGVRVKPRKPRRTVSRAGRTRAQRTARP